MDCHSLFSHSPAARLHQTCLHSFIAQQHDCTKHAQQYSTDVLPNLRLKVKSAEVLYLESWSRSYLWMLCDELLTGGVEEVSARAVRPPVPSCGRWRSRAYPWQIAGEQAARRPLQRRRVGWWLSKQGVRDDRMRRPPWIVSPLPARPGGRRYPAGVVAPH